MRGIPQFQITTARNHRNFSEKKKSESRRLKFVHDLQNLAIW
jgi:hypothetical protein